MVQRTGGAVVLKKPKIAVLLDENTREDASRYEANKGYFLAITDAGGIPFGVPFLSEVIDSVVEDFDGLLTVGGRFAYPDDWYIGGEVASTPESDRFEIEKALVARFLSLDKPVLGMCAGMQMLACLHGCKLTPDLTKTILGAARHDLADEQHAVSIAEGSRLASCVGVQTMQVNTLHREAIVELCDDVLVSATADDGIVEAIELPAYAFAMGLQWHQERFAHLDHPGNGVFAGFIRACQSTPIE